MSLKYYAPRVPRRNRRSWSTVVTYLYHSMWEVERRYAVDRASETEMDAATEAWRYALATNGSPRSAVPC